MTESEKTCLELALQGECHCRAGDCRKGVYFFEAAIQIGTSNLRTLSAIYSQMGNAYFYLQDYEKALEYHRHDLNLAKTIGDRIGEAKAHGNIGNTLKVLGVYDDAMTHCERHLSLATQLTDKIGEARALYNLGNVCHARAKAVEQKAGNISCCPADVQEHLLQAVDFYKKNLLLVSELGDRAAQGRVFGNLGNTYYLLGDFQQAVSYHQQRLSVAKEFGDKSAERRAYSNLGNAFIFQGHYELAVDQYKHTLQLSRQLADRALEAQACYSLGNAYTLLGDYVQSIEYHAMHLKIARELSDHVGESRACWSLGNAYRAVGNSEQALSYALCHRDICVQIGDANGFATADKNLSDLQRTFGVNISLSSCDAHDIDAGTSLNYRADKDKIYGKLSVKPSTTEQAQLLCNENAVSGSQCTYPAASKMMERKDYNGKVESNADVVSSRSVTAEEDSLFELISRSQSRRIDDQRCSARHLTPRSGTVNGVLSRGEVLLSKAPADNTSKHKLDESFFDMLMRCQGSRMDDQRSSMRQVAAPTLPDDDFFNLVQRLQSNRLEAQRSTMPTPGNSSNQSALSTPSVPVSEKKKKPDKKDSRI